MILVYHKLLAHADAEKPTGMDIDGVSTRSSRSATVHFLATPRSRRRSWFGAGVAVYGALQEQYWQAIAAAPIKVARLLHDAHG